MSANEETDSTCKTPQLSNSSEENMEQLAKLVRSNEHLSNTLELNNSNSPHNNLKVDAKMPGEPVNNESNQRTPLQQTIKTNGSI